MMLNMKNFNTEIEAYAVTLTSFVAAHDLPGEWFMSPDHIAIKASDGTAFDAIVRQFRPHTRQISCIDMDSRRLAAAQMTASIPIGTFGEVSLIEIMEPRPENVGSDVVGLEHMEFYYPHLERVQKMLKERGLGEKTRLQQNPGHAWVNIVLNEAGQELKINDSPLSVIIREEFETGKSYLL